MARPIFVLALILIALVGLASAADSGSHGDPVAAAPASDDDIGTIDDDAGAPTSGEAVEGPVGSAEAANSNAGAGAGQGSSSGATTLAATSAIAGTAAAAAVAGYFVF